MATLQSILLYIFSFVALYVQVFFLLVALRKRSQVAALTVPKENTIWPAVTVIVPCWNEERTIVKTVNSLFELEYPKDKLFIKVVDDGSTDSTWKEMQQFSGFPNIELIRKENGGKHTAMNRAIELTTTEYVGCLDADAFAAPDALKKIMWHFLNNDKAMAVSPSILAYQPKGFFQKAQQVEYDMSVFIKKVLGLINGIHVTPGPFSIYKKKVFDDLGNYRKAHNAEDMEIAYRMQINGYQIVQCHDAFVYTVTPNTLKKLYKQRVRWMYGFINNSIDYKSYMFKPRYGVFSMFTVPSSVIILFGAVVMTFFMLASFAKSIFNFIERMTATNFYIPSISSQFSLFYVDARPITFVMVIIYALLIITILIGQKMRENKPIPTMSLIYFVAIYSFISPIWLMKAVYNTIFTRETKWR